MPDVYTRTVNLPAGDSTVTLTNWPSEAFSYLEVTKMPDTGDLWIRFDNGGPATPNGDDVDIIPTGFPWTKFSINHMVHREARRATAPNYVFQVNATAAMVVQFKSAP